MEIPPEEYLYKKLSTMKTALTLEDLDVIQTSLRYSQLKIEDYQCPEIIPGEAYQMKCRKLAEIDKVKTKVSVLRRNLKKISMSTKI